MWNLQEQVKKAFCYQKLFWPFTFQTICSIDIIFANSRPSTLHFKIFSQLLEQFFLTVGQNNFGNKIRFSLYSRSYFCCFVAARRPCHGRVPVTKYINMYPRDSMSSLLLCSIPRCVLMLAYLAVPVRFLFSRYVMCWWVRASLYFFARPKSIM